MTEPNESIRISVVIPAYNKQQWISRAIDSVLSQTHPPDEVIVVDDGSTDNTAEVVSQYKDAVRVIRQDNAGPSAARNAGIQAAGYEWVAFLDADDQWLAEKLALQTAHLQRHPDLQWTTANYNRCLCAESVCRPALDKPLDGEIISDYLAGYTKGFTGHTDTMLIRRDLLNEVGGFTAGQHRLEDLDLWLRIAYRRSRIGYLTRPLATHHLQAGGHTTSAHSSAQICEQMIQRHLELSMQADRADAFRPLAAHLLKRWMRGMLFRSEYAEDVKIMIERFSDLLPGPQRFTFRACTLFPGLTAALLRGISKVVRRAGLRKRPERPPAKKVQNKEGG